jgi:hypothetical protein
VSDSVYQSDPDRAPDSEFVPGEPRFLVTGNQARLLDVRRTPVHLTGVRPDTGFFEVQIDAFEDAGARWLVPVEDAGNYQFAVGSATVDPAVEHELRAAIARYDRLVTVAPGPHARQHTLARLEAEKAQAAEWLTGAGAPAKFDLLPLLDGGWPAAMTWLESYLAERDLADLEESFAVAFVSNPYAGDLVLGHLTVLAELGLGQLTARAIRDPDCFAGGHSKSRRAEHIAARTGFARALWARADGEVMVYRGVGIQPGDVGGRRRTWRSPLISATFSRAVAESHATGTDAGALFRQRLQPDRLFMTFLETRAMTAVYPEAEAALFGEPGPFF